MQDRSYPSTTPKSDIQGFVDFVRNHLKGDEKSEAQVFCDRLFRAFGHDGILEAGGTLEFRIHRKSRTKFADLLWPSRVLIEMKRRGENLAKHYPQVLEYWLHLVPNRPQYVVLCNFDEFWVYDLNHQLDDPMDKIALKDLVERYTALNFLFPSPRRPLFNNDRVAVTRAAAANVANLFSALMNRGVEPISREVAQRFSLQTVVALFAEDAGLLPRGLFAELIVESEKTKSSSYDLIGGLFRQMATKESAQGGRYRGVPYFNGGLFNLVTPVELRPAELEHLRAASQENWAKVHPAIFGSLFEGSMDQDERHTFGAHFTSEVDIYKVILPTIVRPWRDLIDSATGPEDLIQLRTRLLSYRVLDPACGSGNFLYIAYRELKRVELLLLERLSENRASRKAVGRASLVSASQFFGIDVKQFAVELAKVTLMLGKVLALQETTERLSAGQQHLPFDLAERPLPLDNLDPNFSAADALIDSDGAISSWPQVDVVIGNPPFLGAKLLKPLRGSAYVNRLRKAYPSIPGMADYCTYWFRRAHDHLPACEAVDPVAGRAGLVGTQNIRSNKSREAGLDHIVASGTITEAVDNHPWSGEADVHVSIVNWIKAKDSPVVPSTKRLWTTNRKTATKGSMQSPTTRDGYQLVFRDVAEINSSLSDRNDVSRRERLVGNTKPKCCFQGKIPGYEGFLLSASARAYVATDSGDVIHPYLTGRELLGRFAIERWIIDFANRDLIEASRYRRAFEHCRAHVLHAVEESVATAKAANSDMLQAREEHLSRWWQLWNRRDELTEVLGSLGRYIGCSRVTRRPIMAFLSPDICPSDLVQVFAFDDDYSFGVLQSGYHFEWFRTSSKLKIEADSRYSVRSVFETFPWPQAPTTNQVRSVAEAGRAVRALRAEASDALQAGLRDVYRTLELPGKHPLREAHRDLDEAVRDAYGAPGLQSAVPFLMSLNEELVGAERRGACIQGPGIPEHSTGDVSLFSADCYTDNTRANP